MPRLCELRCRALVGVPLVQEGDDLAAITLDAVRASGEELQTGDVVVLAQKVVSKAEGRMVDLAEVQPSQRALELAEATGKDPRVVELVLSESTEVLRHRVGAIVVVHRLGLVLANAGIDQSNVGGSDRVLLLPLDPDGTCAQLRAELYRRTRLDLAVLMIDSIGRAWRRGTIGTALGVSGLPGLLDLRGRPDLHGRRLEVTEIGLADELAAAASLVMGQGDEGTPIVLARGVPYARREGKALELVRPKQEDLFR